jgi:S1-C subfamily serine protease
VRHTTCTALLAALLIGAAATAAAQSTEDRAAARDVMTRRGDAVITVLGTLKARMSQAGRDRPAPDQAVQASATVLDGTGLTVVALSTVDPGSILAKNPAFNAAKMNLETELTDVKLRLADGTEVPAKIVLRDSDLDLLFLRPAAAPAKPMPSVEAVSSPFNAVDAIVLVRRAQEVADWKPAASIATIEVAVEKPRRFYLLSTAATAGGLGSSVFDLKGQFGGIVTLRASQDARHNALNGMLGGMLQTLGMVPVVVPASEIREIAKQAEAR